MSDTSCIDIDDLVFNDCYPRTTPVGARYPEPVPSDADVFDLDSDDEESSVPVTRPIVKPVVALPRSTESIPGTKKFISSETAAKLPQADKTQEAETPAEPKPMPPVRILPKYKGPDMSKLTASERADKNREIKAEKQARAEERARERKKREENGEADNGSDTDDFNKGGDTYEVERIKSRRWNKKKCMHEYLIKWKGWPDAAASWEPETNIHPVLVREEQRKRGELKQEKKGHRSSSIIRSRRKWWDLCKPLTQGKLDLDSVSQIIAGRVSDEGMLELCVGTDVGEDRFWVSATALAEKKAAMMAMFYEKHIVFGHGN
ncbi:Chromo (CHRromatin Organization MOdifier) domain [Carpediemonas membranifera]|uniref:Chromo (CHRromatin Organization MOdifier) domain n=1 Tax=Carpediemonas membranifera TaxID=201153 RepID=A0A8J6AW66_9EUKA|nr:Chromo (CHRromatin Organization MOdifier) domain [Carpediemonas membranifera]|eukprot:KAG9396331.1 Chromo (CHRromatin Organization MOdifier) domain [Carpediemonas membranifera]